MNLQSPDTFGHQRPLIHQSPFIIEDEPPPLRIEKRILRKVARKRGSKNTTKEQKALAADLLQAIDDPEADFVSDKYGDWDSFFNLLIENYVIVKEDRKSIEKALSKARG